MCAYAYYVEDDPLISDTEFDELGKYILEHYDAIDHPHKVNDSKLTILYPD